MGTPTPKGAGVEAVLPRMARVSQEWPWMSQETPWVFREWPWMTQEWPWVSWWGGASVEFHQECPGVVKLVMELHHVSQGGKQGEFRNGGASVWASPCEFRW